MGTSTRWPQASDFFLRKLPLDTLEPGDVLVTNDPWHGTGHLNDFTVVTPVFKNGQAVAMFAATSHIADVGGLGFGPDGRQVFEEALIYLLGTCSAQVKSMKR
ncbi:MAG: hydantoinase B/oxoprolinase family protein [Candidatus Azotimanducaceae bacterium WSBS_2022_MAG_OTU7]